MTKHVLDFDEKYHVKSTSVQLLKKLFAEQAHFFELEKNLYLFMRGPLK